MTKLLIDSSASTGAGLTSANTFTKTQTYTKGADLVSATSITLGTDGNYFDITGNTGPIATINGVAGTFFTFQFDSTPTLTHNATTFDLPGEADITVVAGDIFEGFMTSASTCKVINYHRADGTAVVGTSGGFEVGSSAYLGASQVITTGVTTKIDYDTERYDLGGNYDAVTNQRFVPPVTGEYIVTAMAKGAPGDQKRLQLSIFVAGVVVLIRRINASGTGDLATSITAILQLTATTDYVEIFVFHDKGSDMTLGGTASNESTFDVHRLS